MAATQSTTTKNILAILGRPLLFLLALLLCLPVILLPLSTSVPAFIWLLLAAIDIALLVFSFRLKPAWKGMLVTTLGVLLVAVAAVLASQAFATTPPILDANGDPLPGSIASLEKVTLNGSKQWITIRGQDTSKPVLLFLAGGPGGTQRGTARFALTSSR